MNRQNSYTINCDLGEGIPNEAEIIPWIDVASIACGGHFGDRDSIKESLGLVRKFGKRAGAHPSYPDTQNFGRKTLTISQNELIYSLQKQLDLYFKSTESEDIPVDHIKFHGALYNDAADHQELADLLAVFLKSDFPGIPIFVPPHSALEKAALTQELPIRLEIFGDRAYQSNYRLVGRQSANSLFTQTNQVISHLESILLRGEIKTDSGEFIAVNADTVCFHGDNPGILEFLPQVRNRFWK